MPNKKNLPIPLFSDANLEVVNGIVGLLDSEIEKKQQEQDHLLQLEEEIKSLSHAKEQIAHLKAFRDYLSGPCIKTGKRTTIIQCSGHWKKKECKFQQCETRIKWESLFF